MTANPSVPAPRKTTPSAGLPNRQNAESIAALQTRMIEAMASRSQNGPLPARLDCSMMVTAIELRLKKPSPKDASQMVAELLSLFPNLNTKDADTRMRLAKLSLVFEAYSAGAARHVLDPVKGIAAKCEFLSFKALNDGLEEYDAHQRQVIRAAQWAIEEHDRRDAEAARERQIAADKAAYVEKHGKTPVERVKELMKP